MKHEQFGKLLGITAFEAFAFEQGILQTKAQDEVFKILASGGTISQDAAFKIFHT